MSTFAASTNKRPPPGNVVVPPAAFDAAWERRPKTDVCIGLRFITDDDVQTARGQAAKLAFRLHPHAMPGGLEEQPWADAFEDALIRHLIARGTCDPNDVTASWHGWREAPEDMVGIALTVEGARLIFDAWERMRIATDITMPEATDAEIATLAERATARLKAIEPARAMRVRRLLRFCLDELEE